MGWQTWVTGPAWQVGTGGPPPCPFGAGGPCDTPPVPPPDSGSWTGEAFARCVLTVCRRALGVLEWCVLTLRARAVRAFDLWALATECLVLEVAFVDADAWVATTTDGTTVAAAVPATSPIARKAETRYRMMRAR